jgi:predicted secreted acid phosphatase
MLVAAIALAVAGCGSQPRPQELRAYVNSGHYDREIEAVATKAREWIETRATQRKPGERLAVVFDLDETLLRNWPAIDAENFVYVPAIWDPWVKGGNAEAIAPVREVYRAAKNLGLDVILLTGRSERERAYTERNLQAIGCADATETIFMPDGFKGTAAAFKTAERKRLAGAGRVIIANIGDQESDLIGGFAERTFKVPNPFYSTP